MGVELKLDINPSERRKVLLVELRLYEAEPSLFVETHRKALPPVVRKVPDGAGFSLVGDPEDVTEIGCVVCTHREADGEPAVEPDSLVAEDII